MVAKLYLQDQSDLFGTSVGLSKIAHAPGRRKRSHWHRSARPLRNPQFRLAHTASPTKTHFFKAASGVLRAEGLSLARNAKSPRPTQQGHDLHLLLAR